MTAEHLPERRPGLRTGTQPGSSASLPGLRPVGGPAPGGEPAELGRALQYSYFGESEPFVDDSDETYTDADRPLSGTRTYEWNHSLGEVLTSLIDRGLRIDRLDEHDWTVHQRFPWLVERSPGRWGVPGGQPRVPLSYTVVATREA